MIDELDDQFGLGIKTDPLSIRNFIRWARNTYGSPVKNVLLIGKELTILNIVRMKVDPNVEKLSFIPTFGYPASDNLLAAEPDLNEIPKVTDRSHLEPINADEVAVYLAKVKQYEQQQAFQSPLIIDKGMDEKCGACGRVQRCRSLGRILQAAMDNYRRDIVDTFYGANVNTFSKVTLILYKQTSR
jgi:hypothetical protein